MSLLDRRDHDVFPVFLADDLPSKSNIFSVVMRFKGILDAAKLNMALCRAIDSAGWRKCGGRLRRNDDGRLEIYVPRKFTEETPATRFTRREYDTDVAEHPAAENLLLPLSSLQASTKVEGPEQSTPFACATDAPLTVDDLTESDYSQTALHVSSFHDATFVAISFPLTLMDGFVLGGLLQNWCAMLADSHRDVVVHAYDGKKDALAVCEAAHTGWTPFCCPQLSEHPARPNSLTANPSGPELHRPNVAPKSPTDEQQQAPDRQSGFHGRLIFIPQYALDFLISTTRSNFRSAGSDGYITDTDILISWASQIIARSTEGCGDVIVAEGLNTRGRLPELPEGHPMHIQNMISLLDVHLNVDKPLFAVAFQHRQELLQGLSVSALRDRICAERHAIRTGTNAFSGLFKPGCEFLFTNNLIKTNPYTVIDFRHALRESSEQESSSGKVVAWMQQTLQPGSNSALALNMFHINGRDHDGNLWVRACFAARTWDQFERELTLLNSKAWSDLKASIIGKSKL